MVTTAHTIHSHYCPNCRKRVEPVVTGALGIFSATGKLPSLPSAKPRG